MLLSYHFPPGQATGALRWQKLAPFLYSAGFGLDVVTVAPPWVKATDWSRMAELPPGTRVFGVRAGPHWIERLENDLWGEVQRLRRWRRSGDRAVVERPGLPRTDLVPKGSVRWRWWAVQDYRRAYAAWLAQARQRVWSDAAERLARRIVTAASHVGVVSCGPPHLAHHAGWRVAGAAGLPFIMDMRDPWTASPSVLKTVASPVWVWLTGRYERLAIERAALVVTTTAAHAAALVGRYPALAGRTVTVLNGYDEEPLPPRREERIFRVRYAGSIYIDRDPRPLFRAVARVVAETGARPEDLRVEFLGHVEQFGGVSLQRLAAGEGVEAYVGVEASRPRREAMDFLAQAALLLSLPQSVRLAIPSKVFEYMRFAAWLLVLAEPESATAAVLEGTGADVVSPEDVDGMVAILRRRFDQWRHGQRPAPLATNRFSRRVQAGILVEALSQMLRRTAGGA